LKQSSDQQQRFLKASDTQQPFLSRTFQTQPQQTARDQQNMAPSDAPAIGAFLLELC
jgi:hypothetical protein